MPQTFHELHWSRFIDLDEYLAPASLSQALEMLARFEGRARVIAGGTDVIPQLRKRELAAEALVDISRLPELGRIEASGGSISLGAMVTHAQVAASDLIKEKAPLLAEACGHVGSPQIRNIATVGGNLVSGQPAADASVPLLALDASATVASPDGERRVPLAEFFLDLGQTVVDPTREILTGVEFAGLGENCGSSYQRLAKRKALALPMLVCAVVVEVAPAEKVIKEARIALGPVAPIPFRESYSERMLAGAALDAEILEQAAEAAVAQCNPRDSLLRGSCDYRQEMVRVFVKRGLAQALERAGHGII